MESGQTVQFASGFLAVMDIAQDCGQFMHYHETLGEKYGFVNWDSSGRHLIRIENIRPVRSGPGNLDSARTILG